MANYLKGLGNPQSGVNEIFPFFDAKILRYIMQNVAGVCATEASKFPLTVIDRGVQVGAGMAQSFGYFGMSDGVEQFSVIYPAGSAQYARVFAEINLSVTPHQFSVKASPQGSTSNIPLIQDDLSQIPSGIHQVPLYLLTINSNQTITVTDQRPNLTKLEHAKNAEQSTNAIDAVNSTNANNVVSGGTIASNVVAVTQAQSDNTTKVATTAYVRSAVDAIENITEGNIGISLASTSVASRFIRRQVNFVYGSLDFSDSNATRYTGSTFTVGTIPEGFRPSSNHTCYMVCDNWTSSGAPRPHQCTINTNGNITIGANIMGGSGSSAIRNYRYRLTFGYAI